MRKLHGDLLRQRFIATQGDLTYVLSHGTITTHGLDKIERECGAMNYYQIRKQMGLSTTQMADALGLTGDNRANMVHEIETGERQPTGPIKKLYEIFYRDLEIEFQNRVGDQMFGVNND